MSDLKVVVGRCARCGAPVNRDQQFVGHTAVMRCLQQWWQWVQHPTMTQLEDAKATTAELAPRLGLGAFPEGESSCDKP